MTSTTNSHNESKSRTIEAGSTPQATRPRRRRPLLGAICVLLCLALVGAACSDDDDAGSDTTTTEAPSEGQASEEDMSSESMGNIAEVAAADGRFTTLLAAVSAAGLDSALTGTDDLTVFAPTDDAFAALPEGTVDTLLEDPEGALTDILTYHVVPGAVMAETVVTLDGETVETLNGELITVGVTDDGGVTLTDATGQSVNVVVTDVEADNGVIHVIDGVLMPA